jgi:hypothetical protein
MNLYDNSNVFNELYSEISGPAGVALGTFFVGITFFVLFIALIAASFRIFARWVYFKKCGEPGWKSLIPVYNELTVLKTAGMNWWWIFVLYATTFISFIESSFNAFRGSLIIDNSINGNYGLSFAPGFAIISVLLSLLTLAAAAFTIVTKIGECINISKRFGKSGGYAALIFFFEPIMFIILGFSKSAKYDKSIEVSKNGLFGRK